MDNDVLIAVISGILGGGVVSVLLTQVLQKNKTQAEIEKAKAETEYVRKQTVFLGEDVKGVQSQVAELFTLSMSRDTFGQLKKLNEGWMGHYYLDPALKVGIADELNHLKSLGYIQFDKDDGVKGVEDLPTGNQSNLSQYISVTDTGKRFIKLRELTSKHVGTA